MQDAAKLQLKSSCSAGARPHAKTTFPRIKDPSCHGRASMHQGKGAAQRATSATLWRSPVWSCRQYFRTCWAKVPGRRGRKCHPERAGPPQAAPPAWGVSAAGQLAIVTVMWSGGGACTCVPSVNRTGLTLALTPSPSLLPTSGRF